MIREKFTLILTYTLILLICLSPICSQSNVHPQQQSGDAYEPDNSIENATEIQISETQTHSLYPAGDQDLFHIVVNVSQLIIITITTDVQITFNGGGSIPGIWLVVLPPVFRYEIYLNANSDNNFDIFDPNQSVVTTYTVSINSGGILADRQNHFSNTSSSIELDTKISDIMNYTNLYETDWYTFNITTPTRVRTFLEEGVKSSLIETRPSLIQIELMNGNLTILKTSHRAYLNGSQSTTILDQLNPGTYFLKLSTPRTRGIGVFPYNLTLTTTITPQQQVTSYHDGWGIIENGTETDFGHLVYDVYGTVIANSTLQVDINPWLLGTFHTDFYPWENDTVTYTIDGTSIINSNSSEIAFVPTSQMSLKFNSTNRDCDFLLVITQELSDYYDAFSLKQNPYELHRRNAGTTYEYSDSTLSYPTEVDWWKFTPPVLGSLNITFSAPVKLNITVYNENRTLTTIPSTSSANSTTYTFGEINSTFVLSVSLLNPADLFAQYNITVTYIETYIPIMLTGNGNTGERNSNSVLTHYLLELGAIFMIAIVIMMVVQQWLKNRPRDILD